MKENLVFKKRQKNVAFLLYQMAKPFYMTNHKETLKSF